LRHNRRRHRRWAFGSMLHRRWTKQYLVAVSSQRVSCVACAQHHSIRILLHRDCGGMLRGSFAGAGLKTTASCMCTSRSKIFYSVLNNPPPPPLPRLPVFSSASYISNRDLARNQLTKLPVDGFLVGLRPRNASMWRPSKHDMHAERCCNFGAGEPCEGA